MTEDESARIRELATRFRAAIETAMPSFGPRSRMREFTYNCCEYASNLLLIYFNNAGIDGFKLVTADLYKAGMSGRPDARHVWLERGDMVIDITADQFKGITDKVVVSRDSAWHARLVIESREPDAPDESQADRCQRILQSEYYRAGYGMVCRFL